MERSFMYLNFKLFFLSLWVFWGIYSFNFISAEEFVIRPLKINIFSMQNGKGLETDQNILKDTLEHLGHTVQCAFPKKTQAQTQADINIFVEFIHPQKLSWAKINWFIPNPEWYRQDLELLDRFDLILCRTKEVERIFQKLHKRTYFLSFTSPDCYQVNVPKNYELFAHLPGGSWQKGTLAIKNIWESNSQFPMLMIVNFLKNKLCPAVSFDNLTWIARRLREDDFRALQNHCGIHLCLSETEGFGHYLMEAMSTGAVILTTDAPPMNEFITDSRCLVPYEKTSLQRLAINYHVDPKLLEVKVKNLMSLPQDELEKIGLNNRRRYLQIQQEYFRHLENLLFSVQNTL